jgi:hypothetical protein
MGKCAGSSRYISGLLMSKQVNGVLFVKLGSVATVVMAIGSGYDPKFSTISIRKLFLKNEAAFRYRNLF